VSIDAIDIDGLKVGPCMVRGYIERIAELERCCSQRGARMQIMFEYNKTVFHVIPAEWLAWFDADGVPVSKEIEK